MRSHNAIDQSGKKYHYWEILEYSHTDKNRKPHYLCRCVCGFEIVKGIRPILMGRSKSCGCVNAINHTTHGMSDTKLYNIWQNVKNRCLNPKATQYKWYGGRGIKISKRWMSFESFAQDMGPPPSKKHSIDRINNNGNYTPLNCKWSTMKEQCANRRPYTKYPLPSPPNQGHT